MTKHIGATLAFHPTPLIVGDPEPTHLNMLRMVADESRIVFGSDYPHSPAAIILPKKRHLDANADYDGLRERIYQENAAKLLRR